MPFAGAYRYHYQKIRRQTRSPARYLNVFPPGADSRGCGGFIEVFEGVPVRIALWRADEGVQGRCEYALDRSITGIFLPRGYCVLARWFAAAL